jgi:hypothetical protein
LPTSPVTFNQLNDNIQKIGPILDGRPIEEVIATGISLAYLVQYAMMTPDQFDEALQETSVFISNKVDKFVNSIPPTPPDKVN